MDVNTMLGSSVACDKDKGKCVAVRVFCHWEETAPA